MFEGQDDFSIRQIAMIENRVRTDRAVRSNLTRAANDAERMNQCVLADGGARIDLDIDLPYGYLLEVESVDGWVDLRGLFRRATVKIAR